MKLLLGLATCLLLVVTSLRVFLFGGLQIGHNWDFSFPYPTHVFENIKLISSYTWWDYNLGQPVNLTIAHFLPNLFVSHLGGIVGSVSAAKIVLAGCLIASYLTFYFFLTSFNFSAPWLISLLYTFSPFIFNDIIGGSWYMWLGYAVFPLFVLYGIKYGQSGKLKNFIAFAITSCVLCASLQYLAAATVLVILLILLDTQISIRQKVVRTILVLTAIIGFNLYWIIPTASDLGTLSGNFQSSYNGSFQSVRYNLQNIKNIFNLTGYLDRNMFYHLWPTSVGKIFTTMASFIWLIAIFHSVKTKNRFHINLVLALFLFIFLAKGGNAPGGDLTMFLFDHIPLFSIFRSPQRLMIVPIFLLPVILSLGLATSKKPYLLILAAFFLGGILSTWIVNGDLGQRELAKQKRDHLDYFKLPDDLVDVYRQSESGEPHRIIFLPAVVSPFYEKTAFQDEAQGGQPEYSYLHNPTYTSEVNKFARQIEEYYCGLTDEYPPDIFKQTSTMYVALRRDITPKFSSCADNWYPQRVTNLLESTPNLSLVKSGDNVDLYQFSETERLKFVHGLDQEGRPVDLKFTKVSPVEYKFYLDRMSPPSKIVLLNNFHPKWKISIPSQSHEIIYDYANSWNITLTPCQAECPRYQEVTLKYEGQKYILIGLAITLLTSPVLIYLVKKSEHA